MYILRHPEDVKCAFWLPVVLRREVWPRGRNWSHLHGGGIDACDVAEIAPAGHVEWEGKRG